MQPSQLYIIIIPPHETSKRCQNGKILKICQLIFGNIVEKASKL